LKVTTSFTNVWFPFENSFLEKNIGIKTLILLPYEKSVPEKRTYVNKGCNLLNPLLTVLLALPFNDLPCN
jgi:hypothetical protein